MTTGVPGAGQGPRRPVVPGGVHTVWFSFFRFWARRTTERSEVVRTLETKFLLVWTRQEQDSVLLLQNPAKRL